MATDATGGPGKLLPRVGSYELLQALGTGGMSSVFRARHVESGLEVAVKVLPRTLAKNPTVLQRFLREAKSAEALEHPNIVAIYDRGTDQGRHYLVLEYVAGGDLHDLVRSEGPLDVGEAVAVVRAVAEGLDYAAGRGLIHRDIKPANLLMTPARRVKIADLGLALQADDEDERVTREGTTVGTVDYMAPEQARDSRATSVRSDIYSLGCTFYFLLTGQPPFPGGDVAEKLNRHITTAPPDPREFRPEIPEGLSRLIRKMLAKRPESRFATYQELIAALDALKIVNTPGATAAAPAPLDVLIDDEGDDSSGDFGLVPADDEDDFVPSLPTAGSGAGRGAGGASRGASPISLADLASLDDPLQLQLPAPKPNRARGPVPAPVSHPLADDSDVGPGPADLHVADGPLPPAVATASRQMTPAERQWLLTCVLAGLCLVLLVIAVDQLVLRATGPEAPPAGIDAPELTGEAPAPEESPAPPAPPTAAAATPKPATPKPKATPKEEPPAPAPWVEPVDPSPESAAERGYGAGVESRYLPDWAAAAPSRPAGKPVTVRRVVDPRDASQKPTIEAALEGLGSAAVEVADNGPFFLEHLRLGGDVRAVYGRAGYRPVVHLSRPRTEGAPGEASAFLDLGGKTLELAGLDLVVDVSTMPPGQAALFQLRGGTLLLRDCSVTVLNASGVPFTLVRTAPADRPARVLFDRTFVRGAFASVVEIQRGPAEVALLRSVVVNGQGVGVSVTGPLPGEGVARTLSVVRSLLATRRAALELADAPPNTRPRSVSVRALGSTFVRVGTDVPTSLVVARGDTGGATDLLDWQGDFNAFVGWPSWLEVGPSRAVRVPNRRAARTVWGSTDASSTERPEPWPGSVLQGPDGPALAALAPRASEREATFARVPSPPAYLREKTLAAFPRPAVPWLPNAGPGPAAGVSAARRAVGPVTGPRGRKGAMFLGNAAAAAGADAVPAPPPGGIPAASPPLVTPSAVPGARDLTFDTAAPPFQGDLGRFLADQARPGDTLLRVRVTGRGRHEMTPVRLPEGVSLELVVAPDLAGAYPTFAPAAGAAAEGLIDVRGGALVLWGVHLDRGNAGGVAQLVRVERGHLVIHRGELTAPGTVPAGQGGLVAFLAPGSQPVNGPAGSPWPFDTAVDRPTCVLHESQFVTGGAAVTAELGRGLVAAGECVVIGGEAAFSLRPGRVARRTLDADLWLDHCSVASETAAVSLGPWKGSAPGPDRPWLVSSSDCVFLGSYDRPVPNGVVLRADGDTFARGAGFWQSHGDAFDAPYLAAAADAPLPAPRRFDGRRLWTTLWGESHVSGLIAPRVNGPALARPSGRLQPGNVHPGDLVLDPASVRRAPDLGADLDRLGITARPRGR